MSYDDFQKHLSYLNERGLVEEDENGDSVITEAGRSIYDELRRSLPSIF
jgi:predicted transcriptional regulator